MSRFIWIFGVILLVGSLFGANWAFNNPSFAHKGTTEKLPESPAPNIVMALGHVDGEFGVLKLYPVQSGRVLEIAKEGTDIVLKGTPLLKMDDDFARHKVEEAKASRDNAKAQLDQANLLPAQYAQKLIQLEAAVAAAQKEAEIAEHKWRSDDNKARVGGVTLNPDLLNAAAKLVDRAAQLVVAEKSKLAELKLYDAKLDIARAAANLAAETAKLAEADYALKQCTLVAPQDGTVLRTYVNPGEVYGPTAPRPAIEFLPKGTLIVRAEVLQEWAPRVHKDQEVLIGDDTYQGPSWKGRIKYLSPWFTQKRNLIFEPLTYNDVRYMECLVTVLDEGSYPLRVGQRVRVKIQSP